MQRELYTFVGCGNKSRPKVRVHARLTFDCDTIASVYGCRPTTATIAVGNNWRCSTALITAHLQAPAKLIFGSVAFSWRRDFSANAPAVLIAAGLIMCPGQKCRKNVWVTLGKIAPAALVCCQLTQ